MPKFLAMLCYCTTLMVISICMHVGELSGPGAELLIRFHTSPEIRQHYTILTHGETDTIVALLGMFLAINISYL